MKYYVGNKKEIKEGRRADYINIFTRNQARNIITARSRMLDVKLNFKNKYKDHKCRLCAKELETQTHILEECEKLEGLTSITDEMIFNDDELTELKKKLKLIEERMKILEGKT